MRIEVGVYRGHEPTSGGWLQLCQQEGVPHRRTTNPDAPVLLFERELPEWFDDYVRQGGVAVVSEASPCNALFEPQWRGQAVVQQVAFPELGFDRVLAPSIVDLYAGPGGGELRVHDRRITKGGVRNGRYPIVLQADLGQGVCLYSGLPLTRLLTTEGDTLRRFSLLSDVTERIVAVDKHKIGRILIHMLRTAFQRRGLPYVHTWYYPGGAPSVFAFRIDVDNTFGANTTTIAEVASDIRLPIGFYVNKSLCEGQVQYLRGIGAPHEIGNHADVHNLFDTIEANVVNVESCRAWLEQQGLQPGRWFVAPRGMWNGQLGLALERLDYEYSSDFGLAFDDLPFFPRSRDRHLSVLQIPIHPYSVERATAYAQEAGLAEPDASNVLSYFLTTARHHLTNNLPIFFYSHPQHFGPMASEVLPELVAEIRHIGVPITTLSRFGNWWRKRAEVVLQVDFDPSRQRLSIAGERPDDVYVNVLHAAKLEVHGDHLLHVALPTHPPQLQ